MADIFISYSKDERDLTVALARDLEAQGYSVWWDTSLLAGDVFEDVIMAELEKAKVAIVIWTKSSVKSMWVRSEARRAAEAGKLIPLRVPSVAIRDLPPPFDGYQTDLVDEREKLYAAMAKRGLIRVKYPLDHASASRVGTIKHSQSVNTATGMLIVKRPFELWPRKDDIQLFANGKEIGFISANHTINFTVPIGRILLEAKVSASGNLYCAPIELSIVAGGRTKVKIRERAFEVTEW